MDGRGATLLLTVIIIGAIIVAAGISAAFLGQTEMIIAGGADRAFLARSYAQSCAEEALYRLKSDELYTGGAITSGVDGCSVSVTGTGTTRTVTATATSGDISKTVSVDAVLVQNASLKAKAWTVDSWTVVDP